MAHRVPTSAWSIATPPGEEEDINDHTSLYYGEWMLARLAVRLVKRSDRNWQNTLTMFAHRVLWPVNTRKKDRKLTESQKVCLHPKGETDYGENQHAIYTTCSQCQLRRTYTPKYAQTTKNAAGKTVRMGKKMSTTKKVPTESGPSAENPREQEASSSDRPPSVHRKQKKEQREQVPQSRWAANPNDQAPLMLEAIQRNTEALHYLAATSAQTLQMTQQLVTCLTTGAVTNPQTTGSTAVPPQNAQTIPPPQNEHTIPVTSDSEIDMISSTMSEGR